MPQDACAVIPANPEGLPSLLTPTLSVNTNTLSDEERVAAVDFRLNLLGLFGGLDEQKWNQSRWEAAVAKYKSKYSPAIIETVFRRALLSGWDAVERQLKQGPPKFMQPRWRCPLLNKKADLSWLSIKGGEKKGYEIARGSFAGWREKKVLVLFFWAAWCRPCWAAFPVVQQIASANQSSVQVIGFNIENVFTRLVSSIDGTAVKSFVGSRDDMSAYATCIDAGGVAMDALFFPSEYVAIPSVFVITLKDDIIRWVGPPTSASAALASALRTT